MSQTKLYTVLGTLWLTHFLVDFMIGVWPIYKTLAGLDIATMGIIAGSSVFVGEALQIFFGSLSDRGYCKALIISGLIATSITGLITYTDNYLFLFILFLITCLGSGAFHPSAVGLLGSLSANRKGLFITIFATGGSLGFGLSQLVFANFVNYSALLMIPSFFLGLLLLFFNFQQPKTSERTKLTLTSITALFKKEHLCCLYFTQICNQIVFWGLIFLLPDILVHRGVDKWICFGGAHLTFVLGGALMMVPGGYLADKYSYKTIIMGASTFSLLFFVLFLKFPFISNSLLLTLFFFMGASMMIVSPLVIAFGNKLYPKEPGAISGFLMGFALCIANPLGQTGAGLLTKLFSDNATSNALSLLGIFFFIGLSISYFLPMNQKVETNKSLI